MEKSNATVVSPNAMEVDEQEKLLQMGVVSSQLQNSPSGSPEPSKSPSGCPERGTENAEGDAKEIEAPAAEREVLYYNEFRCFIK